VNPQTCRVYTANTSDNTVAVIDLSFGGQIGTDTTLTLAGSPYCVTSSLHVNSGSTLTIQPGVTLKFSPGAGIQVDGQLVARGTASSPITFTSASASPAPGDWTAISFGASSVPASYDANGGYTGGSALQYALIQYAGGAPTSGDQPAAIQFLTSGPFLDHDTIQKSKTGGISGSGVLNARITNNQIVASGTDGIRLSQSASGQQATITSNVVNGSSGAGLALNVSTGTTTTVVGNTLGGNKSSGIAVTASLSGAPLTPSLAIKGNLLTGNSAATGGGLHLDCSLCSPGTLNISGNTLAANSATTAGGGVWVRADNVPTNTMPISYNTVSANTAPKGGGIYVAQSSATTGATISANVITRNVATASSVAGGGISICNGCFVTINYNDAFGNTAGTGAGAVQNDIVNGNLAPTTVNAQSNWWGTTDPAVLASHIWDNVDDATLGVVSYLPMLTTALPTPDLIVRLAEHPTNDDPARTCLRCRKLGGKHGECHGFGIQRWVLSLADSGQGVVLCEARRIANRDQSGSGRERHRVRPPLRHRRTMQPGSYYVIACANDNGQIVETTMTNNCKASTTKVTVQ